ncbi:MULTISPECIES: hypothetical protein [Collinsella]|uniref:hypothetical protein n=1 Tax=Collinsella TaxID=102106 RepID=UPI0018995F61|nr:MULTISPECIES: hypothetical protein [Collinsella]
MRSYDFISVTQAVNLGIASRRSVNRYIAEGSVQSFKTNGRRLVSRADLEARAKLHKLPSEEAARTAERLLAAQIDVFGPKLTQAQRDALSERLKTTGEAVEHD